ncbi:hypothetical protein PR048_031831 [Dryococelus australis]|uniref:Uncharacterized protein n=1 Tax=Dryococelus australis TaxID=614101 RepID=A0ABQ9G7D6_9NEOP|nr:hypothetical protein PR048_031831 [Dryococelus australis]
MKPASHAPMMDILPNIRCRLCWSFSGETLRSQIFQYYLYLFICYANRVVHPELASDTLTYIFLSAYRRFLAHHGWLFDMHSDLDINFVSAKHCLTEDNCLLAAKVLYSLGVKQHFMHPASPHFEVLHESLEGVSKQDNWHPDTVLTLKELYTVVGEIGCIFNSHMLRHLSTDPNNLSAMTCGHFLTGEPLTSLHLSLPLNTLNHWSTSCRTCGRSGIITSTCCSSTINGMWQPTIFS